MDISKIKIEKGIPVPVKAVRQSDWTAFYKTLEVGDSFSVATERERNNAISHTSKLRKRGIEVTSRKIDGKGYRIWRIK